MDRGELERLDRESLVARAQAAGVRRARVLTRPELVDELLRLDPTIDEAQLKRTRGFFGKARDLLSKVVERGLHLPDAADRLRAALVTPPSIPRPEPQAVPTVTLAEIYAVQGHKARAIETLRRVLEGEPENGAAIALLEKLEAVDYVPPPPPLPPEAEVEEAAAPAEEPEEPTAAEAVVEAAAEPPSLEQEAITEQTVPHSSECVALPIDDGLSVSWRLSDRARRKLEAADRFVVRAVVIVPTWNGPEITTRDVACDAATGELVLRGYPPGAVVRVAVGFQAAKQDGGHDAETFVPLAHSPALQKSEMSGGKGSRIVRWTLDGAIPYSL